MIFPGATGLGVITRAAGKVDDVAQAVSKADSVVKVATKADDAVDATKSAQTAKQVHKNRNDAVGHFGIYEIRIDNDLYKIGKADLDR